MSSKMVLVVMKIRAHLFLLVGVIVCTLLSSSQPASSFLHTPPLFPAASSTINSIRTRRTLRRPPNYDRTTTTRRIVSSLSEQPAHNSIISQLAFYPTDESFSERLKHVLSEWDTVKRTGMGKFFSDEMDAAGKIVKGTVATAEDNANRVMLLDQERSSSLSGEGEGGGDYLLKEGFHNMADTGIQLANEIRAVQQVFNELNAAKIVEEAAEDVVSTGLLMEKGKAVQ